MSRLRGVVFCGLLLVLAGPAAADADYDRCMDAAHAPIRIAGKFCRFYDNGNWGQEGQVLHFPIYRAKIIAERTANLEGYSAFFDLK